MNNNLEIRLKEIKIENIVFGIFIILIILGYYANDKEADYFLSGNEYSKKEYYYLMLFIFIVVTSISAYYFYQSYLEVTSLRSFNSKEKEYAYLELIASASTLLASIIFLYIAITDKNIEAEISL